MGSNSSSGGGGKGRQDAGPNRTVAMNINTGQTINEKGKVVGSSFVNEGRYKSNKDIDRLPFSATKVVATAFKEPLAKVAVYNRKFFVNSVIGNTKRGSTIRTSKAEWQSMSNTEKEKIYKDYKDSRRAGTLDAYGREVRQGDGGGNQVVTTPTSTSTSTQAPKSIEVAEPVMTAEEARAKASDLIRKKRKGVGRGTLIATSPQGVTNEGLTLSEKSLLG